MDWATPQVGCILFHLDEPKTPLTGGLAFFFLRQIRPNRKRKVCRPLCPTSHMPKRDVHIQLPLHVAGTLCLRHFRCTLVGLSPRGTIVFAVGHNFHMGRERLLKFATQFLRVRNTRHAAQRAANYITISGNVRGRTWSLPWKTFFAHCRWQPGANTATMALALMTACAAPPAPLALAAPPSPPPRSAGAVPRRGPEGSPRRCGPDARGARVPLAADDGESDADSMGTIDYPEEPDDTDDDDAVTSDVDGAASAAYTSNGFFFDEPVDAGAAAGPPRCSICLDDHFHTRVPLAEASPRDCVAPACRDGSHAVCASCWRRIVTNFHRHPLGPGQRAITCPHDGCDAEYPLEEFAAVLTATEMRALRKFAQQWTSVVTVACPTCGLGETLDHTWLRNAEEGTVIVHPKCGHEAFCFHCLERPGSPSDSTCTLCLSGYSSVCPTNGAINRFYRVPRKSMADGQRCYARNCDVDVEGCVDQMQRIVDGVFLPASCANCATPMHKTSACNELTHCGLKVCYHCGYTGLPWESSLFDHWDSEGRLGCPRFDNDRFWAEMQCASLCSGTLCGGDAHDCTDPAHRAVIVQQHYVRKLSHLRGLFYSLPPRTADRVKRAVAEKTSPSALKQMLRLALEWGTWSAATSPI